MRVRHGIQEVEGSTPLSSTLRSATELRVASRLITRLNNLQSEEKRSYSSLGHLQSDGDHFFPYPAYIFPDSGNFWSFRAVLGMRTIGRTI